jgi:hypothetical protein
MAIPPSMLLGYPAQSPANEAHHLADVAAQRGVAWLAGFGSALVG